MTNLTLKVLPEPLVICRFEPGANISVPNEPDSFFSLTITDQETSVVCSSSNIPSTDSKHKKTVEEGWRAFRIEGKLDFSLIGVLSKIASILADKRISLFALSTYDTDYFMVKDADLGVSLETLNQNGYQIVSQ